MVFSLEKYNTQRLLFCLHLMFTFCFYIFMLNVPQQIFIFKIHVLNNTIKEALYVFLLVFETVSELFFCTVIFQLLCGFDISLPRDNTGHQGPVVQCVVSLTSSLEVKMLTVLVSTISNSQLHVFLLKKCKSYTHFFQQKY